MLEKFIRKYAIRVLPPSWRPTFFLRIFGLTKVLLIWYVRASIVHYDSQKVQVKIPLSRRTRNHLHSMYFGALAVGADCAGGILAVARIYHDHLPVDFVFKDFHAEFLKRPDGDVIFTCCDGDALEQALNQAIATKERVNVPLHITATVPDKYGDEVLAKFALTLSLKWRNKLSH